MPEQTRGGPLRDVRIIDVTTTFMGPYCTALLANWGADVVKVEAPGGDVLRYIGDVRDLGLGPVFINANRGKRSVVLDLKIDSGRQAFAELVGGADVLVHNLRPKAAERLGVTAENLIGVNPRLLLCALAGFGKAGPYAGRAAYDDVIQAACGLAATQGGRDGAPEYIRSAVADKVMGVFGAAAVLAALHGRSNTGVGGEFEVPMFEAMTAFTLLEQQGEWVYDPPLGPSGYPRTESPHRRPCKTSDGFLAVMIYTDAQWKAFFDEIGQPELAADPRFRSIRERTIHIDELYGLVNEQMALRTTAEWQRVFDEAHIASGAINTIPNLFTDPHLIETGFFESVDHPVAGPLRLARPPIRLAGDGGTLRHTPSLGEHTVEILREAGLDENAIDGLLADKAAIQWRKDV